MNYKITMFALLLSSSGSNLASIEETYAMLFGGHDATAWYQATTRRALAEFGHPHPEQLLVKQMNALAPLCIGRGLYSFSMFNIWYDEQILNHIAEPERIFIVYHEVAHIMQKHHQQLGISLIPAALLMGLIPTLHKKFFGDQPRLIRYSAYMLEWLLAGMAIDKAWFRPWIKLQEKWADLEAVRVLASSGRQDVIDAHVASLELLVNLGYNHSEDWHYNLKDQLDYLRSYSSKK